MVAEAEDTVSLCSATDPQRWFRWSEG